MRSFRHQADNRREVYLNLVNSIETQLRQAYARKHEEEGLSQTALAEKLGVNRSVVHRRLSHQANVTAETIADMVWALGQCIKVEIYDPRDRPSNEFRVMPVSAPKGPIFAVMSGSPTSQVTTLSIPSSWPVVPAMQEGAVS